ncbi:MAG: FAD-binding oxidoreductase [Alteromonadaceae bacterium]|nr:FAD-binding oxidoreductase [Alteromonadaceae bacterium]
MRRWNGWGDESNSMELPDSAGKFLQQILGKAKPLADCSLDSVLAQVPESRLPEHALVSTGLVTGDTATGGIASGGLVTTDKEQRVRHAKGQSLPDWLAMRSGNIGVFPDGVSFPENRQQVQALLKFAREENIELIPYGGGTSVAGHINPQLSAKPVVTVDMSHMNQLLYLDEKSQIATFGAGTPGPMVEAQLRAKGYTLGHFPQSFELSTIGGWVASRSSGQQSLRYGRIEQMFAGGIMETFDGPLEMPTFPASAAGPDLKELVLGSEGRFGIISEVKVRVTKLAEQEKFTVFFFPNWQLATNFCREIAQERIALSMLRVSNGIETQTQLKLAGHEDAIKWMEKYLRFRGCKQGKCMLTLGFTGSKKQVKATRQQIKPLLRKYQAVSTGGILGKRWAENRFRFPYLREALWQEGVVVDTLETATDWHNVDHLLNKVETSLADALPDVKVHVFTHLSHVYGQGCSLYTSYLFPNAYDYQSTLERWKKLKHAASQAIVNNGGTISHQHGVGKDHAPYLSVEKGDVGMKVLANLCQHFDPNSQLNPGTLIADNHFNPTVVE